MIAIDDCYAVTGISTETEVIYTSPDDIESSVFKGFCMRIVKFKEPCHEWSIGQIKEGK